MKFLITSLLLTVATMSLSSCAKDHKVKKMTYDKTEQHNDKVNESLRSMKKSINRVNESECVDSDEQDCSLIEQQNSINEKQNELNDENEKLQNRID